MPGKYFVLDPRAPVAVTTLGSVALARDLADSAPKGLCIVGKLETENVGIEKIIKNVLSNQAIRFLICAGNEPPKHLSGTTLLALCKNGIDASGRIPGAGGMHPVLPNTTRDEAEAFRQQVRVVDLIGCCDAAAIAAKVRELSTLPLQRTSPLPAPASLETGEPTQRVRATAPSPDRIVLDRGGYFLIHIEDDLLIVEHYDYNGRLLHGIEGKDARSICWTLINNGWVTKLDHAAYLGRELARAEFSAKHGLEFIQDGA